MRPAPAPPAVETFRCAGCGASLCIRAPGKSLVVACEHCGAILDAKDPRHQLIERYEEKQKTKPRIPLGLRGKLRGEMYECIGFLRRRVSVEGMHYSWSEYLLWHPHRGYRWLSEYGGHWLYLKPCNGVPKRRGAQVQYLDRTFKKFQSAAATTIHVAGEFYWQVRRGDTADTVDWVSPPLLLSEEKEEKEVVWSIGEYVEPQAVWAGFKLAGEPPPMQGVAPAQPSPYSPHLRPMNLAFLGFIGLAFLLQFFFALFSGNRQVHAQGFRYATEDAEKSRVTESFKLEGRTANVAVDVEAPVENNWAWFDLALINESTGEAFDLGAEVGWWHGVEGGERWSEGSQSTRAMISSVPAGSYYLRIEPETPVAPALSYSVKVWRDVPQWWYFFTVAGLLTVPWLLFLYAARRFEYQRWLESDFPMSPLIATSEDDD